MDIVYDIVCVLIAVCPIWIYGILWFGIDRAFTFREPATQRRTLKCILGIHRREFIGETDQHWNILECLACHSRKIEPPGPHNVFG